VNVVVADGTLEGVVGFGDMFVGDPASDLAAGCALLPAGAAARFFAAYAEADEATVLRARGLAALKSLFLMLMSQDGGPGLPGGTRPGPEPSPDPIPRVDRRHTSTVPLAS
jgi:hypothetical protein